jgi:DNA-binding SARP family transcriptional activator/TolB-like protein/tetratricopeptide (TPR) repeat protein
VVFSLKLLGGVALEGSAGPVTGRAAHKRRLALLAILAVARRPVGRERLIGYLWPDHPAEKARHLLSESLYVLRKELGEDALLSAGDDVALVAQTVASDVAAFEAALEAGELERAAALYQGPFLDGFYVADAPEFERWADGERDRLGRAYARALERLGEREEGAGREVHALAWWRLLARHDPFSSRVALRYLSALEEAGERAEALRFATAHAEFLRAELGVEPEDEFAGRADRLRAGVVREAAPARNGAFPSSRAAAASSSAPALAPGAGGEAGGTLVAELDPEPAVALPAPPARIEAPPAPVPAPGPAVPDAPAAAARPPSRRAAWARAADAAYYAGLVGMVAGLALSVLPAERPAAAEAVVRFDPRRIAVLYIDDNTPGGGMQYLANGITEGLIDRLSQVEALTVVSRNGVKPYRGGSVPFDSVVTDLRVGSVVEGTLQRSGDRLRVTVRLIDANTGEQLERRTVESSMGELFELENRLADEVAGFLRRRLGAEVRLRERAEGTKSLRARELVLRAEQERAEAEELAGEPSPLGAPAALRRLATADSLLARAAQADPRWPEPWVLRGWVRLREARLAPQPDPLAGFRAAIRHAERALERRPGYPRALELRGTARWRMAGRDVLPAADNDTLMRAAERDLKAALTADPSLAAAWSTLSQYLRLRGDHLLEADAAARRALEEDAYLEDAELIHERLYRTNYALARVDSAAAWCERGRREFPASWRFVECRLTLLGYEGGPAPDVRAAWRLVEELDQMDPPARARASGRAYWPLYRRMAAARVLARAGLADSARAVMARSRAAAGSDTALVVPLLYDRAYVHVLLNEPDSAVAALEEYLRRKPRLREFLDDDVQFRTLRDHRGFRALVTPAPPAAPARPPRGRS